MSYPPAAPAGYPPVPVVGPPRPYPGAYPPAYPPQGPAPEDPGARAVPWKGGDVAIVVGVGLLLALVTIAAISFLLAVVGLGGSLTAFAIALLIGYAPQLWLGWYQIVRSRGASWAQVGLRWVGAGPLLLMFPWMLGLLVLNATIGIIEVALFGEVPTAQQQLLGSGDALPLSAFIPLFLVVAIVAPAVEEFVFRGVLFRWLRTRRGFWFSASISSLIFSVSHFIPVLIPTFFALGMVLAAAAERYKSLYPAIALHAINNGFVMIVLFFTLN